MPSPRSVKKDTPASLDTHLDAYSAKAAAALELEEGRRKRPGRGLATCSAAAAGMGLIPALSVDAAIVHNDNGGLGWNVKNGTTATHSFDFDAGGNDFFVKHLGNTGTVGDAATDGSIARLAGGGPLRAHRFAQSETISVGYANWAAASAWLYHPVFTSAQFGPGTNGYVGVRFDSSGTTVYGWIHIDSVGNPYSNGYHVAAYAYDLEGDSIKAGQTAEEVPEPSTIALALLASGAAGVMASRRKKILKGRK